MIVSVIRYTVTHIMATILITIISYLIIGTVSLSAAGLNRIFELVEVKNKEYYQLIYILSSVIFSAAGLITIYAIITGMNINPIVIVTLLYLFVSLRKM